MDITLSGGDFGGEVVSDSDFTPGDKAEDKPRLSRKNAAGDTFIYELRSQKAALLVDVKPHEE